MTKTSNSIARLLFAVGAVALCLSSEAHAQAVAASAPTAELAVLRAQLETTRQFQDSFISMGQWVLGAAVGVAFAIAAFGWYSNKAAYERERDFLRQEAQTLRDQVAATIQKEIHTASESILGTLSSKQKEIQAAVEATFKARLASLDSRISSVDDKVLEVLSESAEREAKESLEKKSYRWALYKYCEVLEFCVQRNTDYYEAGDILDEMRKIIELADFKPDADIVSKAVEALKQLPARHHAVVEALTTKLKRRLA